jgi:hypothetical protein
MAILRCRGGGCCCALHVALRQRLPSATPEHLFRGARRCCPQRRSRCVHSVLPQRCAARETGNAERQALYHGSNTRRSGVSKQSAFFRPARVNARRRDYILARRLRIFHACLQTPKKQNGAAEAMSPAVPEIFHARSVWCTGKYSTYRSVPACSEAGGEACNVVLRKVCVSGEESS